MTDGGYVVGDHHRCIRTMPKCEGDVLNVLLAVDAMSGTRPDEIRVVLLTPLSEDFEMPEGRQESSRGRREMGSRIALEPEEARMLARFLIEAADEWDGVNRHFKAGRKASFHG